jgi:hypothetical protein
MDASTMNNPLLVVIYAAVIFSVAAVSGLIVLRGVRTTTARIVLFLTLCAGLFKGTFWLSRQWGLDAVEVGVAWALALVLVVVVEATMRVRRIKRNVGYR